LKIHRKTSDFSHGRRGDHLLIPFECDDCIFRKLRNSPPNPTLSKDVLLLACIRRMNLDAFWSRESNTVRANADRAERQIRLSDLVGLKGPFIQEDKLPDHDHCGYEVAVEILLYSRQPGRHNRTYTQYDTIRHLRSTYSNYIKASPQSNLKTTSLGDFAGNYQRLVTDKCASLFFKRFMEGLRRRMGQDWRPNTAVSTELLLKVLNYAEQEIVSNEEEMDKHRWVVFSAYITVTYVISLRGPEGFLLDLAGLRKHWNQDRDYLIIPLLGKIKGEHHDLAHLIPCVPKTKSGITIKNILFRLINEKEKFGMRTGPAISDSKGQPFSSNEMNDMLQEALTLIFEEDRSLFPPNVFSTDLIRQHYQVFRSLRRSSDTRAIEMKVDRKDIDVVNRWRTVEQAKGSRPSRSMHQHYAQLDQLIKPFIRYTSNM